MEKFYLQDPKDVLKAMDSTEHGLTSAEAQKL